MNLLQMSFSAAMMIIVISGIRMFAINKLPKKNISYILGNCSYKITCSIFTAILL